MNEKYDTYFVSEIAKRHNTDDNFGKTELTIFLTAEFRGKRAKLPKLGKKTAQKMGATDQPRYNGFRVIRDRVITALQCRLLVLVRTTLARQF